MAKIDQEDFIARYVEEDFPGFLEELVHGKHFSGQSKEEGIIRLVIDKGYSALSERQQYVFNQAISPFLFTCLRGCIIPWTEMYIAETNGGLCGYCAHVTED